jgi:hypothetical protein
MVARFEDFLNDDEAGLDGADLDDSDESDEDSSADDDDDDGEDKEASFDDEEFAQMMQEMMGLPPEEIARRNERVFGPAFRAQRSDEDDHGDIQEVMKRMEEELKEHGVLNLDPTPRKLKAIRPSAKGKEVASKEEPNVEDSEEEVGMDYTLAKNMLEAFKSQGGAAGPAGNLMGLMGVHLPPDKDKK